MRITRTELDPERVKYKIDGETLIIANYDDDGWRGMERINSVIENFALRLGVEIEDVDDEDEE